MAYEQREDSGILFKNDRKGDNVKAPDYKGKINISGEDYDLAAWIREGQKGKFLSLKVSVPGQRYSRPEGRNRDSDSF